MGCRPVPMVPAYGMCFWGGVRKGHHSWDMSQAGGSCSAGGLDRRRLAGLCSPFMGVHRTPGPKHRGTRPQGLPEDAKGHRLWDGLAPCNCQRSPAMGRTRRRGVLKGRHPWDALRGRSAIRQESEEESGDQQRFRVSSFLAMR